MIMLCERCYAPIGESEKVLRLAHIDQAHDDGTVTWVHTYVHVDACVPPRPAPHERPDTGGWDASRGIGSRRT
ncbi:hypothetical protein WEH80_25790 [Actinomycetes bacterium KLBMP 9759]